MRTKQDLYEKVMHYAHLLEDKLSYDETKEGKRWGKLVNKLQDFNFDKEGVKSKVEKFVEKWGQTTEEICTNLGYDLEDSDDLLMVDYFYDSLSNVWLPKTSSLYTKQEQKIADELRYSILWSY